MSSAMKNLIKILMWVAFASLAWVTLSCEEFCEESNRTAMVVNFYTFGTDSVKTMNKISIRGVGNDSILYNTKSLSSALCPLNPAVDITGYIITNDTIAIDTITITYTRHDAFISSECGCVSKAHIDEISTTNYSIKEVRVINADVTTVSYRSNVVNAENIRIYY